MKNIERAFYHELGHYVAHSLNKRLYGRFGVSEFELYPCNENETIWCGGVTPKKPENFEEKDSQKPPPIERLHFVLASVMYGCLFQAYYCNTNLKCCYDKFGHSDSKKWIGFLAAHGINVLNRELAEMEEQYLKKLIETKQLEPFMKISPSKYLVKKDEKRYSVDLGMLEKDLNNIIEEHSEHYQQVVRKYEEIIRKNILK